CRASGWRSQPPGTPNWTGHSRSERSTKNGPVQFPTNASASARRWLEAIWLNRPRGSIGLLTSLFDFDSGSRGLQLLLGRFGLLLRNPLQDRLRSVVHQVLGLFQPEPGHQAPDLLDDLDLLVPGGCQDHVELGLLLGLLLG